MRKLLLAGLFMFLFSAANAQITITSSDIYSVLIGKQMSQFNLHYSSYPTMVTGAQSASSQVFDYSSVPGDYTVDSSKRVYLKAGLLPRSSYFPSATLGYYDSSFSGTMVTAMSAFYQLEASGLYALGSVTRYITSSIDTVIVIKIQPYQLLFPLPLTLGTYRRNVDTMDSFGKREIRTDEFYCTGFGPITFPNHVNTNALRVRHKETRLQYKGSALQQVDWGTMIDFWSQDLTNLSMDMQDSSFYSGSGSVKNIDFTSWMPYTGVEDKLGVRPLSLSLSQNYPNPFNPATLIEYSLKETSPVTLKVYDLMGREVVTLVSGVKPAGTHSVVFDGKDLPSGVYFYELRTGASSVVNKMVLMK